MPPTRDRRMYRAPQIVTKSGEARCISRCHDHSAESAICQSSQVWTDLKTPRSTVDRNAPRRVDASTDVTPSSRAVGACPAPAGKRERFGQEASRLCCRSRAKRKTLVAGSALVRSNVRNEAYLSSCSSFDESDRILPLDLGTVSDTQSTENAERGLLLEPIPVGSILLGQAHQLRRITQFVDVPHGSACGRVGR